MEKRGKMNRKLLTALAIASIGFGVAAAQAPSGMGLGLMAGEPSGFSAKVWTSDHVALDAGLGYSYVWYGQALQIHGDVLFHSSSLTQSGDGFLPLYIGIGARVKLASGSYPVWAGLRVPFGLEYVFARVPVGLFFELVPIFDVTPGPTRFTGNSAIGFRYYFGSHGY